MTQKNNSSELYEILFDTLRGLKEKKIDIEHAKAISGTAQTIINLAKNEFNYARQNDQHSIPFYSEQKKTFISEQPVITSYQHKAGERSKRTLTSVSSDE